MPDEAVPMTAPGAAPHMAERYFATPAPARAGRGNAFAASYLHGLEQLVRRKNLLFAGVITLLPVLIPLAMAMFSTGPFAEEGLRTFKDIGQKLQINALAPLLALFFATMLVAEEAESQTLTYLLTRPVSRFAWVFGRFLAYGTVSGLLLLTSLTLSFAACLALNPSGETAMAAGSASAGAVMELNAHTLRILAQYLVVALLALLGNGAVAMLLGAGTRRPIVYGVIILYGWQRLALQAPGLPRLATIQHHTDTLLPFEFTAGSQRMAESVDIFWFQTGALNSFITLLAFMAFFVAATAVIVCTRAFAAPRAAGS